MARRIVHQLVDDLDGSLLDVGEGETVLFSLDGVAYEIDLTADNAAALRESLATYVSAARPVSRTSTANRPAAKRARGAQPDYTAIRAWAKDNGHQVSDRGRVPAAVLAAYDAAN